VTIDFAELPQFCATLALGRTRSYAGQPSRRSVQSHSASPLASPRVDDSHEKHVVPVAYLQVETLAWGHRGIAEFEAATGPGWELVLQTVPSSEK
jgi:hypothetical protein